jgi:hypothetical protein
MPAMSELSPACFITKDITKRKARSERSNLIAKSTTTIGAKSVGVQNFLFGEIRYFIPWESH